MDIVFVHGWGSGTFIWEPIIKEFPKHDCHTVNLGFLGEEDLSVPKGKFIGIGHSLGGLWLLKHYPDQMVGFISIGSFNCFYKHIPQQFLSKMKKNVARDVTAQLKDFWNHAGLDQPTGFMNLKPVRLIEGLTWLSKWQADIPQSLPVKVLASYDDHIVPKEMTKDIWKNYDIKWIEKGGHMLPLTQSEWCIEEIKSFINAID
jgi:pimeloyl-[acyl-carrier protein] methyl ester esterase